MYLACGTVVGNDGKTLVVHVKDKILALWVYASLAGFAGGREKPKWELAMTARPMRPMSPLRIHGEYERSERYHRVIHTLLQTLLVYRWMMVRGRIEGDGERWA